MKIALIDSAQGSCWRDGVNRLRALKLEGLPDLEGVQIETVNVSAGVGIEGLPLLASHGRETDIAPLLVSAVLVEEVKRLRPDLCIAPLRGGIAHGLLMARACGELPPDMRILLVFEETSRSLALRSDLCVGRLGHLVSDAMERFCLERADALLATGEQSLDELGSLGLAAPAPVERCLDEPLSRGCLVAGDPSAKDLCFVGPLARSVHAVTFIDMAERLLSARPDAFDRVVFLGPIPDVANAPGREWLGRRASTWSFRFKIVETETFETAIGYALRSGRLAYVPDFETARSDVFARPDARFSWVEPAAENDGTLLLEAATSLLAAASPALAAKPVAQGKMAAVLAAIRSRQAGSGARVKLSVCILHKDRPALLRQAIDSVVRQLDPTHADEIEILVFDNGSTSPASSDMLDEVATDARIVLHRHPRALPHSTAMNAMATRASGDYMAFLDDDNMLAEGGLEALVRACSMGSFDVITSNLLIFDADRGAPIPSARFLFVGPARTVGLFFNFLGDTCMAFNRRKFEEIGGFFDAKAPSPAPDWILLVRAQAAGLEIGVLQEPAFLYRRDVERADLHWQKYDQHGLRNLVLRHYGDRYDGALLAKLAQSLMVDHL